MISTSGQFLSQSLQCCLQYSFILDRVITTLDCISKPGQYGHHLANVVLIAFHWNKMYESRLKIRLTLFFSRTISFGNSHRSAGPRPTTLEEDRELCVDFSSILYLWFEIQGMGGPTTFFDWVSNTRWFDAEQVTNHYAKQWWPDSRRLYAPSVHWMCEKGIRGHRFHYPVDYYLYNGCCVCYGYKQQTATSVFNMELVDGAVSICFAPIKSFVMTVRLSVPMHCNSMA